MMFVYSTFLFAIQYLVACVLMVAAMHKVNDWKQFEKVTNDYEIVPPTILPIFVLLLPVAEFVAAGLLFTGPINDGMGAVGLYLALGLFLMYTLALFKVYLEGRALADCGCGVRGYEGPVTKWPLMRNGILLLLLINLIVFNPLIASALVYWDVAILLSLVFTIIYWVVDGLVGNSNFIKLLEKSYD